MTGKLHHRVCTLVAGLMIHAAMIASLPLVWCFGSNTVHAAERIGRAPALEAAVSASVIFEATRTVATIDHFASPLNQKCTLHHKLMDVGAPVSKPAPDKDKFVAVVPNHDQLTWCSPKRVGPSTWVGPALCCAQLEQLSTVFLLI